MNESEQLIREQMNKPSAESKKWKMTMIGIKGICLLYIISNLLVAFQPSEATNFANMMQITMYSFSGIISLFLGAQGAVDFRNSASLAAINTNHKTEVDVKTETIHLSKHIDSKDIDDLDDLQFGQDK